LSYTRCVWNAGEYHSNAHIATSNTAVRVDFLLVFGIIPCSTLGWVIDIEIGDTLCRNHVQLKKMFDKTQNAVL